MCKSRLWSHRLIFRSETNDERFSLTLKFLRRWYYNDAIDYDEDIRQGREWFKHNLIATVGDNAEDFSIVECICGDGCVLFLYAARDPPLLCNMGPGNLDVQCNLLESGIHLIFIRFIRSYYYWLLRIDSILYLPPLSKYCICFLLLTDCIARLIDLILQHDFSTAKSSLTGIIQSGPWFSSSSKRRGIIGKVSSYRSKGNLRLISNWGVWSEDDDSNVFAIALI